MKNKKAVILLSGGLDSATTLYFAKAQGFKCFCLIFDYGQRHRKEIESAIKIAKKANCQYQVLKINLPWKGSALLDKKSQLPITNYQLPITIPVTYVPARNIIFLSFALSYAETIKAEAIFIGAHTQDYPGYPDCRDEFYQAFRKVISLGTKAGVEHRKIEIKTPLINKTKAQIVKLGEKLAVPFALTWSCYQGSRRPCGRCQSCYFRQKGFIEAGLKDPLLNNIFGGETSEY
ncbi:MAG: 7-cyano-7-deazaguanine synthase QueC [Candidatus Omnitrophica bacterium]|nr:7-cyano-7-deazaguanine synthase QueC [Candidatus Omnitrophota bacterium]